MVEEITQLLADHQSGKKYAIEKLYPVIYEELRVIAHGQLKRAWGVDTICTTALVSEVYIKLIGFDKSKANDRRHFFAIAAKAMRQIILSYAEKKNAKKRGSEWKSVSQTEFGVNAEQNIEDLILIDKALAELESVDEDLHKLVELRFFSGMTEQELAEYFEVSTRTIRRNWQKAKLLMSRLME